MNIVEGNLANWRSFDMCDARKADDKASLLSVVCEECSRCVTLHAGMLFVDSFCSRIYRQEWLKLAKL